MPPTLPADAEAEAEAAAAARHGTARERIDVPVRDDRPARLARPRPGAAHRAPRRRPPRPLRDRRRRRVRRPRRRARPRDATRAASPSTRPTPRRRCTRPSCPRAPRACSPASGAQPSCGRSTSTRPARSTAARTSPAPRSAASPSTPTRTSGGRSRRCWPRSASGGWRSSVRAAASALDVPEQEVVKEDGVWTVRYRVPLADRGPQRADLAAHRHGRRRADAARGTGILRTQPPPSERSLARLRRQAAALGVDVAGGLPVPRLRPQPRSGASPRTPR